MVTINNFKNLHDNQQTSDLWYGKGMQKNVKGKKQSIKLKYT